MQHGPQHHCRRVSGKQRTAGGYNTDLAGAQRLTESLRAAVAALRLPAAPMTDDDRAHLTSRGIGITNVAPRAIDERTAYQLVSMMRDVVQRGTGTAAKVLGRDDVGGKTGSTNDHRDAWFAGFTNEITIVVWVGYDNADGTRRTLGRGQTGGHLAVPIAGTILQAAWANGVPRTALAPPSPEARQDLLEASIDPRSGQRVDGGGVLEHFRIKDGRMADTQYKLLPRETRTAMRPDPEDGDLGAEDDAPDLAGGLFGGLRGQPDDDRGDFW